MPEAATAHWWEPVTVETGATAVLALGPLVVQVHRGSNEWLVGWQREEAAGEPVRGSVVLARNGFRADAYQRYVTRSTGDRITMKPVLADRPVVIRPRQPVAVLPGEDATLYLSSPVWVRIEVGDPPQPLEDIPVLRLSDTWFGPSTREGELCYAARTHARHALTEVVRRPHRAVTPVRIHNTAASQLPIEKLSLPVPLLSVYGDEQGSLWTESVSLSRTVESDMAALAIAAGPPGASPGARQLTVPREAVEKSGLVRAFSGFFS